MTNLILRTGHFPPLYILPITLCLAYLTWLAYNLTIHPLAKYPGPLWEQVSQLWYVLQVYRGDLDHTMRRLHRSHGAIVRIAARRGLDCGPDSDLQDLRRARHVR